MQVLWFEGFVSVWESKSLSSSGWIFSKGFYKGFYYNIVSLFAHPQLRPDFELFKLVIKLRFSDHKSWNRFHLQPTGSLCIEADRDLEREKHCFKVLVGLSWLISICAMISRFETVETLAISLWLTFSYFPRLWHKLQFYSEALIK